MGADGPLMGLQLHGRFQGVNRETGGLPELLIDFDYRDNDGNRKVATRRPEFQSYSPITGELTEIGKKVLDLQVGDQVAVSVWANPAGRYVSLRADDVAVTDAAPFGGGSNTEHSFA